ncbi:MAG: asparagine synthase (glutamine-hydrolyzing) [Desulfobacteraceae bacterium]|jgi:asparagine synthase (glutamine-hydrolysing)|nr:MAG: asparagine synthase (glutamine-hydrolyzing) [Desulfobacteraceae bacterium]
MCGICGIVSSLLSADDICRRLDAMNALQGHRGPDDRRQEVFSISGSKVGLGFVRLSILDIETGMQPLKCMSDQSAIVCNGQIYNYIELRDQVVNEPFVSRGDIEVALHLYRIKGIEFLNDLNGMYAGAIYDPAHRRLLLFRDRFGIKPLYYTFAQGGLVFSSEIKPLLAGSDIRKELNLARLSTYFTYRYVPGDETLFKGVYKLPPGSYLIYDIDTGTHRISRYWEYRLDKVDSRISIDDAADAFETIFSDAVRIRMRSDVEVGCLISGGIDSAAVSASVGRIQPDVRLFTIGFEDNRYNEIPAVVDFTKSMTETLGSARLFSRTCRKQNLEQLPGIIYSLEEPISLGTVIPTDMVCDMAARQLKVVLTGEGADEIFGGYRKFVIEAAVSRFPEMTRQHQEACLNSYPELKRFLSDIPTDPAQRYIRTEALFSLDQIRRLTGCAIMDDPMPDDVRPLLAGVEDPVNQMIAFEARMRLPEYVVLRLDRLSMRHSLEARTPLLDFRLAEFAATLPVNFKIDLIKQQEKFICRFAYLKHGIIDRKTAMRAKQPFTIPLTAWLLERQNLPDVFCDILYGNMIARHGILNPKVVKTLLKQATANDGGPDTLVSAADQLFSIIVFSLWYHAFFLE